MNAHKPSQITWHYLVIGQVQGVGFRYKATILAKKHQLSGRIRNLEDGNVEIIVQGDKRDVNIFFDQLKQLPAPVDITAIQELSSHQAPALSDFQVDFSH